MNKCHKVCLWAAGCTLWDKAIATLVKRIKTIHWFLFWGWLIWNLIHQNRRLGANFVGNNAGWRGVKGAASVRATVHIQAVLLGFISRATSMLCVLAGVDQVLWGTGAGFGPWGAAKGCFQSCERSWSFMATKQDWEIFQVLLLWSYDRPSH